MKNGRGGWLGIETAEDIQNLNLPPTRQQTVAERQAEDAELNRIIDLGIRSENQRLVEELENELDAILRPPLETMYGEELLALKATKNTAQHLAIFKTFANECREVGVRPLPAKVGVVASYTQTALVNGASADELKLIVEAISWAHRVKEVCDPTESDLVRGMMTALSKGRKRKKVKLNGASTHVTRSAVQHRRGK